MEIIGELFKQTNPLAWAIGAVALIVLGLLVNKIIPAFPAKQAFIIVLLALLLVPIMFVINRLLPTYDKAPEAKRLTLILHEPGNRNLRPLNNRGRVELRDTEGHRMEGAIDEKGTATFDSVPDWAFNDKLGVAVAVFPSVADNQYSSPDILRFFQPNKEFYIELVKTPLLPEPQPPVVHPTTENTKKKAQPDPKPENNDIKLFFVSKTTEAKMPLEFDKRKTLMELQQEINLRFKNIIKAEYEDMLTLLVNGKVVFQQDKSLSLSAYGMNDNDEIGIVKAMHMMKTFPKTTFYFIGKKFINPIVYIDNNKVENVENDAITQKITAIGSIFNPNDSCLVRIMDGTLRYSFKLFIKDKKEITVDMTKYKGFDFRKIPMVRLTQKITRLNRLPN